MKAAVIPAVRKSWEIVEVPIPQPDFNQVLIKIRASGLCYTDIHITEGSLPEQWLPKFPCTIGHEPVGEIVAIGPAVQTRKVGDRVGVPWLQGACGRCEWCARGKEMFCSKALGTGAHLPGGHAEYMLAYEHATMLLPEKLSYEQAAPLLCAGYTVWGGLRLANPQPGERVAVLGIGGLGHLAIQYAKAAGFETYAISHTPGKQSLIRELGAHGVFEDGESLHKAGGADIILACSNSYKATAESLNGIRPDGRLVLMGFDSEPLSLGPVVQERRARIIGSQQNGREYLYEALNIAATGKVRVMVETFKFENIGTAYARVASGSVRFRAVITD
jgi:alcohol dehydrogenase